MHSALHVLLVVAKTIFFALPSAVAFLIAVAALAVVYMEELQTRLKDQRRIRWIVAVVLLLIGVGAFVADTMQKTQERNERDAAVKETAKEVATETSKQVTTVLTEQYTGLVAEQQERRAVDKAESKRVLNDILTVIKNYHGDNTNLGATVSTIVAHAQEERRARDILEYLNRRLNMTLQIRKECGAVGPPGSGGVPWLGCVQSIDRWIAETGFYILTSLGQTYQDRFDSEPGFALGYSDVNGVPALDRSIRTFDGKVAITKTIIDELNRQHPAP
jgi:hypothetical protein